MKTDDRESDMERDTLSVASVKACVVCTILEMCGGGGRRRPPPGAAGTFV